MKELPILEQSAQVQPSLGGGNFGAAAAQSAQADLQIANFGAEIAQNAATQRARLAGIEAGKNPRGDVGVFTKTDEAYVQAYKQEALSTLDFKGKQVINDMYADIAQNPTSEALTTFKNSSLQTIEELVANAPKEIQGDLHRSLEGTAMNNFYSLFGAFNQKEMKNYADVVMHGVSQGSNEIYDRAVIGDEKGANEINSMVLDSLKAAVDKGAINPSAIMAYKDTAKSILQNAKAEYEMNNAKSPEAYLAEMQNKKWLAELPATERNNVIANTVNRFNQQQAALGAQQGINYIEYQTKIATGQMTQGDWIQAESKVDGGQFAQLKYKQATMAAEGASSQRLYNEAKEFFGDTAFLKSNYSPEQIEKIASVAFKDRAERQGVTPDQLSLTDKVKSILPMKVSVPSVTKMMSNSLSRGSLNQAMEVVDAIGTAELLGNRALTDDLSSDDKSVAAMLALEKNNAEYTKQDLDNLRQSVYNATAEQKKNAVTATGKYLRDNGFDDPAALTNHLVKALNKEHGSPWFGKAVLPLDINDTYKSLLRVYSLSAPPKIADQLATRDLANAYQPTNINGRYEYMSNAPESILPNVGNTIKNNMHLSFYTMVRANQELQKLGKGFVYGLEWPDMPENPEEAFDSSKLWGPKGNIRFKINGQDATLIIKSDQFTSQGKEQGQPSWAFYYTLDNNPSMELALPFSTSNAAAFGRWNPKRVDIKRRTPEQLKAELKYAKENPPPYATIEDLKNPPIPKILQKPAVPEILKPPKKPKILERPEVPSMLKPPEYPIGGK